MRIIAELIGMLLIGTALFIGWWYLVRRWFTGPAEAAQENLSEILKKRSEHGKSN